MVKIKDGFLVSIRVIVLFSVAFVLEGRDLIEFLEFDKAEHEVWPHPNKFMLELIEEDR